MQPDVKDREATSTAIVNVAAYRFVPLEGLPDWRISIRRRAIELHLRGTVLLSPEGINLFVAGTRAEVDQFLAWLRGYEPFAGLEVKASPGDDQPFNRMLVRIKKEIIALGAPGIDPVERPCPKLSPRELKQWLDEGRPVTLLDTRNDYEVALGTFDGAIPAGISHFRQFPDSVQRLPAELKQQPIVMFCTGGIRCEKAGPVMQQQGYEQVWQLDGGILKYFEECGGAHYHGDCFVFDRRVSVDPALRETGCELCFACRAVLTPAEQKDPRYRPPLACPHCFRDEAGQRQLRLAERQARLDQSVVPLPGSEPWTNVRPLNVPLRFDQLTLLELLTGMHPHLPDGYWADECRAGRLVRLESVPEPSGSDANSRSLRSKLGSDPFSGRFQDRLPGRPLSADTVVRSGWRIGHLEPHSVEPTVNAAIRILHDDDAIVVVDKPAPLPMHPSGRFHRNTLVWMLNRIYAPEVLRPAHRLDANTTGVVVLSRSRAVARQVQPQFEAGTVEKLYLARVNGRPEWIDFRCDAPIGREAVIGGARSLDPNGLPATTLFRVIGHPAANETLIECRPLTGRTNQIRLHLASLGYPIVGDPVYGRLVDQSTRLSSSNQYQPEAQARNVATSSSQAIRAAINEFPQLRANRPFTSGCNAGSAPEEAPEDQFATLHPASPRMCLHSATIGFLHPANGERVTFSAPLPAGWEANEQKPEKPP